MPSYGSGSRNQTMDDPYLWSLASPTEELLYEENQCSSSLQQSGLLNNSNAAFNSYPPSFGRPLGSAYLDNSWYDAECAEPLNLQNEPNYSQTMAKRVKTNAHCPQQTRWDPSLHIKQEFIPQRNSCAHQTKCKAAMDLTLEIITGSTAKLQGSLCSTSSHDSKDPTSPKSSYLESPVTRSSVKRSSSTAANDEPLLKISSSPTKTADDRATTTHPTRQAKTSHCQVERKYRENLNTRFETLRRTLPSMQQQVSGKQTCEGGDVEDFDHNVIKPRKAEILSGATDYVKQLEERNGKMSSEIQFLRSRVKTIEKLINCEDCYLLNGIRDMRVEPPGTGPAGGGGEGQWME